MRITNIIVITTTTATIATGIDRTCSTVVNHNEQASDEHHDQSYCDMGIAELLALVAHAKSLQESRQSKLRMICPGTQFSPSSFRAARAASLSASSVTPLGALHRKVEMPAALFKPS